jgi:NitT/TauT family transport system permease protein
VVVPLTVPQIFVAVRVALGVCWATVVAAELVAAQRGLGAMRQEAQGFFRMDEVFAGVILIGISASASSGRAHRSGGRHRRASRSASTLKRS